MFVLYLYENYMVRTLTTFCNFKYNANKVLCNLKVNINTFKKFTTLPFLTLKNIILLLILLVFQIIFFSLILHNNLKSVSLKKDTKGISIDFLLSFHRHSLCSILVTALINNHLCKTKI